MNLTKNQSFLTRLGFALAGLKHGVRSERSLRTQLAVAALVLMALVALRPPAVWWALIILAIAAVLAAELFNTALERLIDRLHPDLHADIRMVKDCAAAAVLVLACGAVCVALAFVVSLLA